MSDSAPQIINLNKVHPGGEITGIPPHLDLLKKKTRKETKRTKDLTGTKDPAATQVVDSSDTSVSSSKGRLDQLSTMLTKARETGQAEQNPTTSLVDEASLVESKIEDITSLLQDAEVHEHVSHAGTENTNQNDVSGHHEEFDRFNELSRLKARLEMVRNEKTNKVHSLSRSMNRKDTETLMVDSPPPPPPSSSPVQQTMNAEHFMNRLVSKKESRYIETDYQESESKSDDISVDLKTHLISHVRMAIQQNDIGSNDVLLEDPIFRLVYLAKELADQARQINFFQCQDKYFSRMKSLRSMPPSTLSHPIILQNQESFTNLDPSMNKLDSHPAPNQTSGNLPPFEYLLKKLQAAEKECMELVNFKEILEASLIEANTVCHDMELSVQALKEELEATRATNIVLSEELDSAKEEIAVLKDGNKKFEDELERTQNRLGDAIVYVSDLESEAASLREMVDEKDKEIDENMVLFNEEHQSVVSVLDQTREIRLQMTNLQGKLSEEENYPGQAQKICDDWLKEALPQLDSMDMALTTCKLELEVKVQSSDDGEHTKESSASSKARWSLFRISR